MTNIWDQYADKLAGGWKCISYDMFDGEGPNKKLVAKPHGDEPMGRVLLSRSGYISAHMARPDRMVPFESGNKWQTGTDQEVAHVARGLSMYCGYLKLYEDERGGIEERRVQYVEEGGKQYIILQPKQDMLLEDGSTTRAVLKWEKFE